MATEATDKSLEAAAKKETAGPVSAFKTKTQPKLEAAGTALKESAPTALSLAAGHLVGLKYKKFKRAMQESALQRLKVGDYSRRAAALAKQAAAPIYEMRAQDRRAEQEGAQPARMFAQATGERAPAFDDSEAEMMGLILEKQLAKEGKDRELDLKTLEGALDDAAEKGMITADFVQKLLARYKAARKDQVKEGFELQQRDAAMAAGAAEDSAEAKKIDGDSERVGEFSPFGKPIKGAGGYTYHQRENGEIIITVAGPAGLPSGVELGKPIPRDSDAWIAINKEIKATKKKEAAEVA